jgi:hypothetical protein
LKRLGSASLVVVSLVTVLWAQSASARIDRDQLRIAVPRLHFLIGEALSRLHDGATVRYELELIAKTDRNGRTLARTMEQFAVSYDLWEEKFAVTKLGSPPRSISHLSASAAEAWCIDNISIPTSAISPNQQFWIQLDYRAGSSAASADPSDNSGFTLTGLIDIFSRRTRSEQVHGSEEIGPLRLDNLKRR